MTEFVCRRTGRTYRFGEQLDRGGDAVIYAVEPESSHLALKQYLPSTLVSRPDLETRIQAMIDSPPPYRRDRDGRVSCAWPEDAAYVSGRFVGFVMPRLDTTDALTIHDAATACDKTWRDRVTIAENLARLVALLHDSDVVVGEFGERNLLTWSDHDVTLLACDRMQVTDPRSSRRFPCLAGGDGAVAPELLHASLWRTLRTGSSDVFALAVQLHVLLLQGVHPFRGEWKGHGQPPTERALAQDGLWVYGGDPRLSPGRGAAPLAVLPETLRRYFRAAFVDGARNPQARPPAQEWVSALERLRSSLVPCGCEPGHLYGRHLPRCPWCPPATPSPSGAEGSVPPGYVHLRGSARRQRPPTASPPATPAASPAPDRPATAQPPTSTDRPRRPSAPGGERKARHRAAPWAAAAAGICVAVGVALGSVALSSAKAPATVATGPAAAASTPTSLTAPSSLPRPQDPSEALEQVRAQDAAIVETLAESWVAQLSARPASTSTADRARTDAAILAGHDALRRQYPGAVLLLSADWNYHGRFWVTVMGERFVTAEDANAWCDGHGFAPRECFAKKLSHSGAVEGSTRYRR